MLRKGDLLAENFCRKPLNPRFPRLPGAWRKARLDASLVEESLAIPPVLGGHLRQQKAGESSAADDQSIAADDDVLNAADDLDRTHDGDLQLEHLEFVSLNREESRIAEGGRHRAGGHCLEQRLHCAERSDAAAQ